jgi:hypothetical protein
MVLVCMLPWRQKPEGTFMAPTYNLGGSDSSHTRQGGIKILITVLTVVLVLLDSILKKNRENTMFRPVSTGLSIDYLINFPFRRSVFSTPKVLRP